MFLEKIAYQDFLLVHHEWPPAIAKDLIATLSPLRVIVTHPDSQKRFDLFHTQIMLDLLETDTPEATVLEQIPRDRWPGVPLGYRYQDADSAPDQVVVLDDQERLWGFYDADLHPEESVRHAHPRRQRGPKPIGYRATDDFPECALAGQPFEFKITLERKLLSDQTYNFDPGTLIRVHVFGLENLEILGEPSKEHTLSDLEEEGLERIFRFTVLPTAPGGGKIKVVISGAAFQGVFEKSCRISSKEKVMPGRQTSNHDLYETARDSRELTLVIIESNSNDEHQIHIVPSGEKLGALKTLYGPLKFHKQERIRLPKSIFTEIDQWQASREKEDWSGFRLKNEKTCEYMTGLLLEPSLRSELWKLRDSIKSLQIISSEMDIPWELCRLNEQSKDEEGFFFAEKWPVVRWISSGDRSDSQLITELKLDRVGLVFAPETGDGAKAEKEKLKEVFSGKSCLLAPEVPDYTKICQKLFSDRFDCWHFVGKSIFNPEDPDFSQIMINEKFSLRPCDISGMKFHETAPIIFLNGCQTGRVERSFKDLGGWAKRFIDAGASVFIGTYWNVGNHHSAYFSEEFYKLLLANESVGNAAHKARNATKDPTGDPTWLSYTIFADINARVLDDPIARLLEDDE